MKVIVLSFVLALSCVFVSGSVVHAQQTAVVATDYNATITVKIDQLDRKVYVAIVDAIAATNDIGIDYSCVEAGILVFKVLNTTFSQPADARAYLARKIEPLLSGKAIKYLDVHVEPAAGISKC